MYKEKIMSMHLPRYNENKHSESIVIFVHGFMGSPDQFETASESFFELGFSTASVLLPGHGISEYTFTGAAYTDWENHLQNEIDKYCEYKNVFIVGHSVGGLLALNASVGQSRIKAVAAIFPPLKFYYISGVYRKIKLIFTKNRDIREAYIKANSIRVTFLTFLLFAKALYQPLALAEKTKKNLAEITVPALIIHSRGDETVSFKSAEMFEKGLINSRAEFLRLEASHHGYMYEDERKLACGAVRNFISSHRNEQE